MSPVPLANSSRRGSTESFDTLGFWLDLDRLVRLTDEQLARGGRPTLISSWLGARVPPSTLSHPLSLPGCRPRRGESSPLSARTKPRSRLCSSSSTWPSKPLHLVDQEFERAAHQARGVPRSHGPPRVARKRMTWRVSPAWRRAPVGPDPRRAGKRTDERPAVGPARLPRRRTDQLAGPQAEFLDMGIQRVAGNPRVRVLLVLDVPVGLLQRRHDMSSERLV